MSSTRKSMVGVVASNKMQKTVVVTVEYIGRHPLYRKIIHRRRHFLAHDEQGVCQEGDQVRIVETRPLSRTKRWRVAEVLKRAD